MPNSEQRRASAEFLEIAAEVRICVRTIVEHYSDLKKIIGASNARQFQDMVLGFEKGVNSAIGNLNVQKFLSESEIARIARKLKEETKKFWDMAAKLNENFTVRERNGLENLLKSLDVERLDRARKIGNGALPVRQSVDSRPAAASFQPQGFVNASKAQHYKSKSK